MKDHTENKINEELHDFFEKATPDIYDTIEKDCKNQKPAGKEVRTGHRKVLKTVLAAAACLALLLSGAGVWIYETTFKTDTAVFLDVNPGVRINLNRKDEVLDIVPTNEDGENLMDHLEFRGDSLEEAVDTVVDRMLESGYLGDHANSVLVTVKGKNAEKSRALQSRVSSEIDSVMGREGIHAAILSQNAAKDDEITALAEKYGLSEGKAQLILEYTKARPQYTAADLAGLTVNELNLLIQSSGTVMNETDAHGQASEKNYIGAEKAVQIALNHFGKTETEVQNLEKELETENGILVYDIEFEQNGTEYSAEINAVTGKIEASGTEKEDAEEIVSQGNYIEKAEAERIALASVGKTGAEVKNLETELEEENGIAVYSVEFDTDTEEFEIDIDAKTGKIIRSQKETPEQETTEENSTEVQETVPETSSEARSLGEAEAGKIALDYAGLAEAQVKNLEVETETENGILVYSVEFETDTMEYEIEIHGQSGEILSVETEPAESEDPEED